MMKSLSSFSRTAAQARIFPAISSAEMTSLPAMWPQRLGKTWSSMFMPARPMAISRSVTQAALTALPPPVSISAMTGIETAWVMFQDMSRTSFIRRRPTSGLAR